MIVATLMPMSRIWCLVCERQSTTYPNTKSRSYFVELLTEDLLLLGRVEQGL